MLVNRSLDANLYLEKNDSLKLDLLHSLMLHIQTQKTSDKKYIFTLCCLLYTNLKFREFWNSTYVKKEKGFTKLSYVDHVLCIMHFETTSCGC